MVYGVQLGRYNKYTFHAYRTHFLYIKKIQLFMRNKIGILDVTEAVRLCILRPLDVTIFNHSLHKFRETTMH